MDTQTVAPPKPAAHMSRGLLRRPLNGFNKAVNVQSAAPSINGGSRLNNRLLKLVIDPATRESDKTAVADEPPLNLGTV